MTRLTTGLYFNKLCNQIVVVYPCFRDIFMSLTKQGPLMDLRNNIYTRKKLMQSINSPEIFLFLKQKQCGIFKIIEMATNVVCQK